MGTFPKVPAFGIRWHETRYESTDYRNNRRFRLYCVPELGGGKLMKCRRKFMFALACLALLSASALAFEPPAERLALVGGTLVDGFGGRPIRNSVVIIEGERIKAVGHFGSITIPADAKVISTEGMTVLPGLWDAHVHLFINGHTDYPHWDKTYTSQFRDVIMPASAKQLLMAGVTSARDVGAVLEA